MRSTYKRAKYILLQLFKAIVRLARRYLLMIVKAELWTQQTSASSLYWLSCGGGRSFSLRKISGDNPLPRSLSLTKGKPPLLFHIEGASTGLSPRGLHT